RLVLEGTFARGAGALRGAGVARGGLTRGLGPGWTRGLGPGWTRGLGPGWTRWGICEGGEALGLCDGVRITGACERGVRADRSKSPGRLTPAPGRAASPRCAPGRRGRAWGAWPPGRVR